MYCSLLLHPDHARSIPHISGTSSNEKPSTTSSLTTPSYHLSSRKPLFFLHQPRYLVMLSHRALSSNCAFAQRGEYRVLERGRNQLFGGVLQLGDRSVGGYIEVSVLAQRSKGSRQHTIIKCTASEEAHAHRPIELPIFPLPLVLFPGAIIPLQIFEF